jgi:hypothetical protein
LTGWIACYDVGALVGMHDDPDHDGLANLVIETSAIRQ